MKKLFFIFIISLGSFALNAQIKKDVNYYICKSGPEFKLTMPNIFTPNRDFVNDYFLPKIDNEVCLDNYYMGIYNRWGQLLYETTVYSVGWHGNTFYGDPYPEGTYYYRMSYTVNDAHTDSQKAFSQQGVFQLLR